MATDNMLIHWECLAVMDDLIEKWIKVDAIITDPPYGTTACKRDSVIPFDAMWERLNKLIKPNGAIVLFGCEPFSSALRMSNIKNYKYDWIWEKSHPSGIANVNRRVMKYHENVIIFYQSQPTYNPIKWKGNKSHSVGNQLGKRTNSKSQPNMIQTHKEYSDMKHPKSVIKFSNPRSKWQHPTQKPVALMEYLIKTYTNEWETVLDFTMWSWTTWVACKNTNRDFIGIEMDDNYFEVARERLE